MASYYVSWDRKNFNTCSLAKTTLTLALNITSICPWLASFFSWPLLLFLSCQLVPGNMIHVIEHMPRVHLSTQAPPKNIRWNTSNPDSNSDTMNYGSPRKPPPGFPKPWPLLDLWSALLPSTLEKNVAIAGPVIYGINNFTQFYLNSFLYEKLSIINSTLSTSLACYSIISNWFLLE